MYKSSRYFAVLHVYTGINISHYSLPNGYGIVSKFTEFSEKFSVLRSQKIEKIATFEEKNEKKI